MNCAKKQKRHSPRGQCLFFMCFAFRDSIACALSLTLQLSCFVSRALSFGALSLRLQLSCFVSQCCGVRHFVSCSFTFGAASFGTLPFAALALSALPLVLPHSVFRRTQGAFRISYFSAAPLSQMPGKRIFPRLIMSTYFDLTQSLPRFR